MTTPFGYRPRRGLVIDDGVSATSADAEQIRREIFFANGSGDDLVDAVAMSLEIDTSEGCEESGFGDPLDLLIRAEEEAE